VPGCLQRFFSCPTGAVEGLVPDSAVWVKRQLVPPLACCVALKLGQPELRRGAEHLGVELGGLQGAPSPNRAVTLGSGQRAPVRAQGLGRLRPSVVLF